MTSLTELQSVTDPVTPAETCLEGSDKGRKCDQVLAGARRVFMEKGYEGASVDEIAKAAGVSKATLYNHFTDKRFLFIEVMKAECDRQSEGIKDIINPNAPLEEALLGAAMRFVTFKTSTLGQEIFRICVAESMRFPDIGRSFYDSGPGVITACMVNFLEERCQKGELDIDDCEMAASQFGALCKASLFDKRTFGVIGLPSAADIAITAEEAVRTFLARYGVPKGA